MHRDALHVLSRTWASYYAAGLSIKHHCPDFSSSRCRHTFSCQIKQLGPRDTHEFARSRFFLRRARRSPLLSFFPSSSLFLPFLSSIGQSQSKIFRAASMKRSENVSFACTLSRSRETCKPYRRFSFFPFFLSLPSSKVRESPWPDTTDLSRYYHRVSVESVPKISWLPAGIIDHSIRIW